DGGNNTLVGQGGKDLIVGGDGDDRIIGYDGTMLGGAGNDNISSERNYFVLIDGGAGADRIELRGVICPGGKVVSDPADTLVDNRSKPMLGECRTTDQPPQPKKKRHHRRTLHRPRLIWQDGR